jgi:rhomboid protease GluP
VSHEAQTPSRKATTCPKCKALNGAGFDQCVRCGHALSSTAQALNRFGARVDGESMLASKIIMAITVFVFATQVWIGQLRSGQGALEALLRPTTVDAVRFGALHSLVLGSEPWRLVSAIFVHFGTIHLLGNMFFLTWLGRIAEPAVGSARFAVAYVVTGVAGFVASTAYAVLLEGGGGLTAGASGAVFGITGMVLGMLYRQKNPQWKGFALQAVFYNLLIGFAINQARVGIMINNLAHLGGLVVGIMFGFAFAKTSITSRRALRAEPWVNLSALVGLLVCVASLVLAQLSPVWRQIEMVRGAG